MNILCVDTSMKSCHVALIKGDEVFEVEENITHGHAVRLVPLIEDLLLKAKSTYKDIDVFAVTKGPGSFTGIRVGLATLSAAGLALDKPVLGFSTLELMVLPLKGQKTVACIDTKCGDYFTQAFDESGIAQSEITCLTKEAAQEAYPGFQMVMDEPLLIKEWASKIKQVFTKGALSEYSTDPLYVKPPEAKRASYLPDIQWNS